MKSHEAARINVEVIGEWFKQLDKSHKLVLKRVSAFLRGVLSKWNKMLRRKFKKRHTRYKLDFTRIKVQHQVTCRKPKHLIKKII